MLSKRIIPCLDVRNGRVVKGVQFQNVADVDDPVKLARFYSEQGADELVFYDITASNEERDIFLDVVANVAREISIPFTVGGGIRGGEDFHKALAAGADKVSVNSAAVKNPEIIREAALNSADNAWFYPSTPKKRQGNYTVYLNGGRVDTGMDAVEWALAGEKLGAGEIVLNVMDADGGKNGFQIDITREIAEKVTIPVVASGGSGQKRRLFASAGGRQSRCSFGGFRISFWRDQDC